MFRHEPGRGRCRRRAPRIAGALRLAANLAGNPFEIGLDEAPGAHVLRLLLAPDEFGILEARKLPEQRFDRERIKLLDPQQVDVIDPALFALVVEVIVDLTRADNDATDLFVLGKRDLLALM